MTFQPDRERPGPRRLDESLDRVTRRLGTSSKPLGVVFGRWEEIAGASVAAHCRPVGLVRGRLLVEADHHAWGAQLRSLTSTLQHRIDELAGPGVVTEIVVRVGSG